MKDYFNLLISSDEIGDCHQAVQALNTHTNVGVRELSVIKNTVMTFDLLNSGGVALYIIPQNTK